MRAIFFRDHEISGLGPAGPDPLTVGVAYLGYLYARHPRRVAEVGLVHLDEPAEAAETGPATGGEATP